MGTARDVDGGGLPPVEPIARLPDTALEDLRRAVARSGYAFETLAAAERVAPQQLDAVRLPVVHWWLERRPGPDAVLARLFAYEARVPIGAVRGALGEALVDALARAGILAAADGRVEARLRLTPFEGLLLLSDPPEAGEDAVMGPGPTTVMLARSVPPSPGAVLDVGCGAGTLALLAAGRGATRAVGVDLSARAVTLARVNARLNGLAAEFREGDLLAPVRGEAFDLVVSQPPYVPLPEGVSRAVYLHGGARGDELAVRFAGAFPAALGPRGRAVLLFDTPSVGAPVHEALRAALGDAAVDLAVLVAPGPSADLQAVAYGAIAERGLGNGYREALRRYRDHLEALGAAAFSRVLVVLRAADRPGGRFTVELPVPGVGGIGAAVLDRFLGALDLASAPDAALLAARVRPAPEARLHEERAIGSEGRPAAISVRFQPGWVGTDREVSEAGAFLLEALSGAASVDDAVARFAEAAGEPAAQARRTVVDFVREALSRGLLVPG
ncbi:MAG TPA: PqqD family peptide modification chaperone [Anaeromyxobacter sp.]